MGYFDDISNKIRETAAILKQNAQDTQPKQNFVQNAVNQVVNTVQDKMKWKNYSIVDKNTNDRLTIDAGYDDNDNLVGIKVPGINMNNMITGNEGINRFFDNVLDQTDYAVFRTDDSENGKIEVPFYDTVESGKPISYATFANPERGLAKVQNNIDSLFVKLANMPYDTQLPYSNTPEYNESWYNRRYDPAYGGVRIPSVPSTNASGFKSENFSENGAQGAAESLRRGEDVYYDVNDNGKPIVIDGGIYGMRYLGTGLGDVTNKNYFSDREATNDYEPIEVGIVDRGDGTTMPTLAGFMTVKYDENGAIAEIDMPNGLNLQNGKKYPMDTKLTFSKDISKLFKDMALDTSNYFAFRTGGDWHDGVFFGANDFVDNNLRNNYYQPTRLPDDAMEYLSTPTTIFGSRGKIAAQRDGGYDPIYLSSGWTWYGVGDGAYYTNEWKDYWHKRREEYERINKARKAK